MAKILNTICHCIIRQENRYVPFDLGFAYTTFSDWINGKKYPRIDKIEMMANYFNIAKSDLVESKRSRTGINLLITFTN